MPDFFRQEMQTFLYLDPDLPQNLTNTSFTLPNYKSSVKSVYYFVRYPTCLSKQRYKSSSYGNVVKYNFFNMCGKLCILPCAFVLTMKLCFEAHL